MVKFAEVAKLVDYEVVLEAGFEERDPVVKIQIPLLRAAAPAGLVILDGDPVVRVSIELIPVFKLLLHESPSLLTVFQIYGRRAFFPSHSPPHFYSKDLSPRHERTIVSELTI